MALRFTHRRNLWRKVARVVAPLVFLLLSLFLANYAYFLGWAAGAPSSRPDSGTLQALSGVACLSALLPLAFAIGAVYWLRPRTLPNRCDRCDYPLEGTSLGTPCPECGHSSHSSLHRGDGR